MAQMRLADGRAIPDAEVEWSFARSTGPGGQSVNTTDSAVRLAWDVEHSTVLTEAERERVLRRQARRIKSGRLIVTAREHRSQWSNRRAAQERLVGIVDAALAPPPPNRKATKPSRASQRRRVEGKKRRGETKRLRGRPDPDR